MIEEKKLSEIYDKFSKELFIYIFRFLNSRESAEDILHDSFVNFINYSRKHEIKEDGIRAFLYRTAHNLSINFLKRQKKIKFTPLNDDSDITLNEEISRNLEYKELQKEIYRLLDGIDDLSRSIFIMKKELKMGISEISENTGKSERTIRRRLQEVVEYLSKSLKNSGILLFFAVLMSFLQTLIVIFNRGLF